MKNTISVIAIALALSACGGGGGDGGNSGNTGGSNPPPAQATLSGRAIDGYLGNATVCVDLNNNGMCDAGEPAAKTDAKGNYNLPYSDEYVNKKLLVLVDTATTDASRPAGYTFPASFTLSRYLTDAKTDVVVSPLTSLVVAQMESGATEAQAREAVSKLLGQSIDVDSDYVAAGNQAALTTAMQVVDTLTSFAKNGSIDPKTLTAVLSTMADKQTTSVTQADIQDALNQPTQTLMRVKDLPASPLISLYGLQYSYWNGGDTNPASGNTSLIGYQHQWKDGRYAETKLYNFPVLSEQWQPVPLTNFDPLQGYVDQASAHTVVVDRFDAEPGVIVKKPDGTWSDWIANDKRHDFSFLKDQGARLSGVEPATGMTASVEFRRIDLSNQPLNVAVPKLGVSTAALLTEARMADTHFAPGTSAVATLLTYDQDRLVITPLLARCMNSYDMCGSEDGPAFNDNGHLLTTLDMTNRTYSSIDQIVGQSYAFGSFQPDGTFVVSGEVVGHWKKYGDDTLVLTDTKSSSVISVSSAYQDEVAQGALPAVSLYRGHLVSSLLYPKDYVRRTVSFAGAMDSVLSLTARQIARDNVFLSAPQPTK